MLSPGDFAQWVVSLSAASGVVYSIIRNGKGSETLTLS